MFWEPGKPLGNGSLISHGWDTLPCPGEWGKEPCRKGWYGYTDGSPCNRCKGNGYITYSQQDKFPLREVLIGQVNKMRFVYRFNTALVLHRESNAEHTYFTSLYAYILYRWTVLNTPVRPNIEVILSRVLFHDTDETVSGDFTRPFKHSSPELTEMLHKHARLAVEGILDGLFPDDSEARLGLLEGWEDCKKASPTGEGQIISIADYLSVLSHMWYEINCSNYSMSDNYDTMLKYVETFKTPEFLPWKTLLDPVIRITHSILKEAKERIPKI